jgi:F-type H+-transporting ATPase subunit b
VEHGGASAAVAALLWPAINFALFVLVLGRALAGPLREFFRARTERLREGLAAGARARAEAAALCDRLAREVAELPARCERVKADLRAAAEAERANLVASAERAAERIRADARLFAAQELDAARQALRTELIEEAIREAAAVVRAALGPEDQRTLVRDFIAAAGALA